MERVLDSGKRFKQLFDGELFVVEHLALEFVELNLEI
jgi:hypothetical protein